MVTLVGSLQRDDNNTPVMGGTSSVDNSTVINAAIDPVTRRLLTDAASGSGTVSSVSVVTANGFSGSVANPTTTPAITLSTTISGIIKGNGTALSSASAGTDYVAPGSITTSGLTQSTARILGRTTASSGAVEEISVGTGLSLSAGTLSSTALTTLTVGSTTITSGTNTRILYDNSGVLGEYSVIPVSLGGTNATSASITAFNNITGYTAAGATGTTSTNLVFSTSPTLVTPTLGVASATSINKVAITAPASSATLTIADGKTLTANNSIALSGTDSTTMTFPSTNATIARTDAAQTFVGIQTIPQILNVPATITVTSNAGTVTRSNRINNFTNSSAATMTITMSTTGATDGDMVMVVILDASAAAQTIAWVNTEDSTVTAPTTSNGSTTLPLTVGFKWNAGTSKWRCTAKC